MFCFQSHLNIALTRKQINTRTQDSTVSVVNRLWPDEPTNLVSIPLQKNEICLTSRMSRPATYSVGNGTVFSGGKAADHEVDHVALSSTQLNECCFTSTPSYAFMVYSRTTVPYTDYKDSRSFLLYIHLHFKTHSTLFGHLCVYILHNYILSLSVECCVEERLPFLVCNHKPAYSS
jgi:hypothetical protein